MIFSRSSPLLLFVCVWFLACGGVPTHPYELRPDAPDAASVRGVFLAPMNPFTQIAGELHGGAARLRVAIEEYLESHGKQVRGTTLPEFKAAAEAASSASGESLDPEQEGELTPAAMALLMDGLQADGAFDVLVIPELFARRAKLAYGTARWDGVRRHQQGGQASEYTNGLSLRVRVYGRDGIWIFYGIGGLDLIFRVEQLARKIVLVDEPLSNRKHLDEGIGIAFHRYLSPSAR